MVPDCEELVGATHRR